MLSKGVIKLLKCNIASNSFSRQKSNVGLLFFEPNIQKILKKLSKPALDDAFPVRKDGERLKPPEYKFLTDEELQIELNKAEERSKKWLQMPPVLDPRDDTESIISCDKELDGHDPDGASYIFTDITYGIKDEDRTIVTRELNGTLKYANWEQRHRMAETFIPRPGRDHDSPAMFHGEHFESLLKRKEYKFILDRACAQYEPNDPDYIRVTTSTYIAISKEKDYRHLLGTRHFGSMLFYLVFSKQVDTLLLNSLQNDRLDDAISLVHLYHMIHPDAASIDTSKEGQDLVKAFIAKDVSQRGVLELALQACLERQQESKLHLETVEKVHGIHC